MRYMWNENIILWMLILSLDYLWGFFCLFVLGYDLVYVLDVCLVFED